MPDIVFMPNHAGYEGDLEGRLDSFLDCCREGKTEDWTCKKTASRGDLYLFWFGDPAMKIAGVGICQGDVDEEPNKGADWTNYPKLWACSFQPLRRLTNPITLKELKGGNLLADWWYRSKLFKGRPKRIKPKVAHRLLILILQLNPGLGSLLAKYLSGAQIPCVTLPDDDDEPPPAVTYTTSRRIRNTAKGEKLKRLYGCQCQVCRHRIHVPRAGGVYAEVHHLRPLGGEHMGLDNWNNMLVLCPNCHAEFDGLAMALDPATGQVSCFDNKNSKQGRKPWFRPQHALAPEDVDYHWRRFCKAKARAAKKVLAMSCNLV